MTAFRPCPRNAPISRIGSSLRRSRAARRGAVGVAGASLMGVADNSPLARSATAKASFSLPSSAGRQQDLAVSAAFPNWLGIGSAAWSALGWQAGFSHRR